MKALSKAPSERSRFIEYDGQVTYWIFLFPQNICVLKNKRNPDESASPVACYLDWKPPNELCEEVHKCSISVLTLQKSEDLCDNNSSLLLAYLD